MVDYYWHITSDSVENDDCPVQRQTSVGAGTASATSGPMKLIFVNRHNWVHGNCGKHSLCEYSLCAFCKKEDHAVRSLLPHEKENLNLLLKGKV
jgi:hypothetical protein